MSQLALTRYFEFIFDYDFKVANSILKHDYQYFYSDFEDNANKDDIDITKVSDVEKGVLQFSLHLVLR